MANTKKFIVKNGVQTPNITFKDSNTGATITATMNDSTDTLSFEGDAGQLFSITDGFDGTIFSVNDITGIPSIEVDDEGIIKLAEYNGKVLINTTDSGSTDSDVLVVGGNITLADKDALLYFDSSGNTSRLKLSQVIQQGSGSLNIQNDNGTVYIGAENATYAHIRTDRSLFYIADTVEFGTNEIRSYNGDFQIKRDDNNTNKIVISDSDVQFHNGVLRIDQDTAPSITANKLYNVGGTLFWNGTDVTSGGGGGTDSATVSAIITADVDKAFVDALNVDADTLDGIDGASFLRSNADDTYSGGTLNIRSNSSIGYFVGLGLKYDGGWRFTNDNSMGMALRNNETAGYWHMYIADSAGTADGFVGNSLREYRFGGTDGEYIKIGGQTVWHAGNDGSGSTLDADLLDGVEGSSFLRSDAADAKTSGDLTFNDNVKAKFGTSGDLEIFHNASSSVINDVGTGKLTIGANDRIDLMNPAASEYMARFIQDGAVELYHDNSKKLETTSAGVTVTGLLSATTKSFDIEHPTKKGMRLRYGSLEGPENGVYVRGRLKGNNTIELPDYWTGLVDEDTITVNLTPIGKHQEIYVEDIGDNKVIIGGEDINCFYTVYGERKDVDQLVVEYDV